MKELINSEEFSSFWQNDPLVILDTSSILHLFECSPRLATSILKNLELIVENIWLPNQVLNEYEGRKKEVKNREFNKFPNVSNRINQLFNSLENDLDTQFIRYKRYEYPDIKDLENEIRKNLKLFKDISERYQRDHKKDSEVNKTLFRSQDIESFIETIIAGGQVGIEFNTLEKLEIYKEGEQRYRYSIPPGYEDIKKDLKDKTNTKKFGDLIVWKELLRKAADENKPFIFITEDDKEDWWEKEGNKLIGARRELLSEFNSIAKFQGGNFMMLTIGSFNNNISRINSVNLREAMEDYLEINAENIILQIIATHEWTTLLEDNAHLTPLLISDGQLQDFIDYAIADVEIEGYSEPSLNDIYIEYQKDSVDFEVMFKTFVEVTATSQIGQELFHTDEGRIHLSGKITLSFNLNYTIPAEYLKVEKAEIAIDNLEIESFDIINSYSDANNNDICINCQRNIGDYHTAEGEMVCEKCIIYYEVCPDCGLLFEEGTLSGAKCSQCMQYE